MENRITVDQLEQMKTHELADLLANVVLLLRRMPNVECYHFVQQVPDSHDLKQPEAERVAKQVPSFTKKELSDKNVLQLRALAKELNVLFTKAVKKDDLIQKILAKSHNGHSEQQAIQNM